MEVDSKPHVTEQVEFDTGSSSEMPEQLYRYRALAQGSTASRLLLKNSRHCFTHKATW